VPFPPAPSSLDSGLRSPATRQGVKFLLLGTCPSTIRKKNNYGITHFISNRRERTDPDPVVRTASVDSYKLFPICAFQA
jgi:hypothetical protein